MSFYTYKKTNQVFDKEAVKREIDYQEQISRWKRGEIEAKWEPCISGRGEALVIEPEPGNRIVVERRGSDLSLSS